MLLKHRHDQHSRKFTWGQHRLLRGGVREKDVRKYGADYSHSQQQHMRNTPSGLCQRLKHPWTSRKKCSLITATLPAHGQTSRRAFKQMKSYCKHWITVSQWNLWHTHRRDQQRAGLGVTPYVLLHRKTYSTKKIKPLTEADSMNRPLLHMYRTLIIYRYKLELFNHNFTS